VLVPVWVKQGEKLVPGLTAADFELTDNGVPQKITSIATASEPVDVTIVLDTSGSLEGERLIQLQSGVQAIARALTPSDRIRLLSFANTVTEVFTFRRGGESAPVGRVSSGGLTSLYDAFAAALMSTPRSDRPQLVFGVTDGRENASALKPGDVVALAGSSGASLYVTIVRTNTEARGVSLDVLYVLERLREASARTGGLVFEHPPDTALPVLFAQVLADFRTSYLLSFSPQGVRQDGWHDLVVRTKDRRHVVRARAGYQG
jgi:hypothetical protein